MRSDGLRDRCHLRQCSLNVGRRTKEYLHHRHAIQRLRFDVLNVIDQRSEAALRLRGDAVRHVLGRKPLIVPDHADHRNINVRENVRGRAQNHDRGENQDQQRHHDEGVGPAQG